MAPLIAIGISILALIVTVINTLNTRRTSKIALRQFMGKMTNFEIYLINSFSISIKKEKFLIFHITLTNKSDAKNSFQPTMILEYIDTDDHITQLQLPHVPEKSDKLSKGEFTFFSKQIFLNEKESTSKWLLFSYNESLLANCRIDSYSIKLKDISGVSQTVRSTIIKEL